MFKHKHYDYDLIVIGSGSGGNVAAHYASERGKKVLVFEKDAIGGECPNFGCIPTKALLHSAEAYQAAKNAKQYGVIPASVSLKYPQMRKWKDLAVSRTGAADGEQFFERNHIHLIKANVKFISPHEVEAEGKTYSAEKFLIASGADTFIPPIEGLKETGYITYREAIDLDKPLKSVFIVGGGPIGCEFTELFSSLGTEVTIADALKKLLSHNDEDASDLLQKIFEDRGVKIALGANITKVEKKKNIKVVHYTIGEHSHTVEVEELMIATGKRGNLDFDIEKAGIKLNNGHLVVDPYLQTSAPHIFAAGDVIGPLQFTHTAAYQSYIAAQNMFSHKKIKEDLRAVPSCIFTKPEVASVGITEQEAKEKGLKIRIGRAAVAELGKANVANEFDGFVKVITDPKGVILGATIVCPHAGEMIHELALAVHLRLTADQIAGMIHAFPTYSEAVKIACANVE